MRCDKCGNKITGNANFCRICGTPVKKDNQESDVSMPTSNEIKKEEKINNSAIKDVELTDNIDVTKIKIEVNTNNNIDEVSGDEIKVTKESADKEFKAMLEITSSDNQQKKLENNPKENAVLTPDANDVDIKEIPFSDSKEEDMKINVMPGEANALEIQSTNELEELLSSKSTGAKKVEEILSELNESNTPTNNIDKDDLNAVTMVLPDELIIAQNEELCNNCSKISDSTSANDIKSELNEETTPILPLNSDVSDKNHAESSQDTEELLSNPQSDSSLKDQITEKDIVTSTENQMIKKDSTENELVSDLAQESNVEKDEILKEITDQNDIVKLEYDSAESIMATGSQKKSGKVGIIVLSLLLIICLAGSIFVSYRLIRTSEELNDLHDDNKMLTDKINELEEKNSHNNDKVSSNGIIFNGYSIKVDSNDGYIIEDDNLTITTSQSTIKLSLGLGVDYLSIKSDKDSYREMLMEFDYTIKSYGTKVVDGQEYVVYEAEDKEDGNLLIAYTSLSNGDTISFIITDENNEINYDSLNITNKILSSAKKNYSHEKIENSLFIEENDS